MEKIDVRFTPIQDLFDDDEITLAGFMKKLGKKFGEGQYFLKYRNSLEGKNYTKILEVHKISDGFLMTLGGDFLYEYERDFDLGSLVLLGICKIVEQDEGTE